ncbi:hypothetical protein RQP46_005306 [Phenoliferia psychrophenolica]
MSSTSYIPTRAKEWRLPERNGIDSLQLVDFEVPKPGVDEVLVKIEAASLQYRDLMLAKAYYPLQEKKNLVPGSDGAGVVVAVGPTRYAQQHWKEGDRVAGQFTQMLQTGKPTSREVMSTALGGGWDGVFTQYRIFPAFGLVKIPDSLSFEEASTLPCAALTAYDSLYGSGSHVLRAGQWVLALGTGGVSIFSMQFALSSGAHCIITSSSDAKLQKAKEIAGENSERLHLINYSKTPDWELEVLKLIPRGVDFVVEVGGNGSLPKSFASAAMGGMVAAIGFVAGAAKETFPDANGLMLSFGGVYRGILVGSRSEFEEMIQHVEAAKIKPSIDKVFKFEELKEAYRYLESQKPPSVNVLPPSPANRRAGPAPTHARRQSGMPQHMYSQGYVPTPGNSHTRRPSVVDIAADFLGPSGPEQLAKMRQHGSKVEDWIDTYSRPIRPWLPALGRFLIIVTFLEDAHRILTQISDQNYYLQKHRGFPWGLSHAFLYTNVIMMLACSALVMAKRYPEIATGGLFGVVLAQGLGYGLIFDLNFFLRNLSVIGGLLMVLSDSLSTRKSTFANIPSLDLNETDRKKYFQLAGRVLLVFLFLGFVFNGKFSVARTGVSVVGLAACIAVALGYKAKISALFLVTTLSIFNFSINNFWAVHSAHPQRDFLKYDFFQTLSIVGGLLLLVNLGPGDLSMDQSKKHM